MQPQEVKNITDQVRYMFFSSRTYSKTLIPVQSGLNNKAFEPEDIGLTATLWWVVPQCFTVYLQVLPDCSHSIFSPGFALTIKFHQFWSRLPWKANDYNLPSWLNWTNPSVTDVFTMGTSKCQTIPFSSFGKVEGSNPHCFIWTAMSNR